MSAFSNHSVAVMAASAGVSGQSAEHQGSVYNDILASDDDELDPRVKAELESLNQSAADVNCLEKEIDAAREKYQMTFSESFQQLELLKKKSASSIKKARPYFELREAAKKAQQEALQSARKFQAANGVYLAAKETISLAELRLMDDRAVSLSAAWQEMLNHALVRVTEAESEKTKTEKEHLKRAAMFADMELRLHGLEKKQKKSISKARSYFETKKELEIKLQQLKQTLEDLQQAMRSAKRRYSVSLHHLEAISNHIHERRRQKLLLLYPREPGVGAEEEHVISTDLEGRLASMSSACDEPQTPSEVCDSESLCGPDSEGDGDGHWAFEDIQNESVFRARVLSTSLDEEDTSFMDVTRIRAMRKGKLRAHSLPLGIGQGGANITDLSNPSSKHPGRVSSLTVCGSDIKFGEEFGQGVNPDRCNNTPPDGDSLSHEDNLSCGHGEEEVRDIEDVTGEEKKRQALSGEESSGLQREEDQQVVGEITAVPSLCTKDIDTESKGGSEHSVEEIQTNSNLDSVVNHIKYTTEACESSRSDTARKVVEQIAENSTEPCRSTLQSHEKFQDGGEAKAESMGCESVDDDAGPCTSVSNVTATLPPSVV
ncbi:SH3 domain-binding protein 5 [Aplysia californica]|uniref:SH3 domain-binding protein 5 n=1 Tax=Aplysia californica TaxID=6500 RepID=A0ABM0K0V4_APLCA|nr:SH3 domain-binding protein 5 [Aplysia californica]